MSVLIIFLITTSVVHASYSGNESDYLALLSFKSMITHDPYGALSSWNDSLHFCDWKGVICGKRHRRVTRVVILSQGLQGSLSPHIGNLSFVHGFGLWNNSFQNTIPHEIGRLSRLRILDLGGNNFSGIIPTNVSRCSNLKRLSFVSNNLVGSIPKEIGLLSKLTLLVVDNNNLTGGISPFLGNITTMERFSTLGNPLGGSIPDTLGNWKRLQTFDSGLCNLHGTIPHSIYNLSLLTNFSLPENYLTGNLPLDMGATLPHLVLLQLWGNQLSGVLPPSISNCSKLRILEISYNNFSGKLAINFANLRDIIEISLYDNLFGTGEADEMKFIDYLQNCTRLETLQLSSCKFQGVLPRSLGNLSNHLNRLTLADNRLYGSLPSSIGNMVSLNALSLSDNHITGTIPFTIGKLQKLQLASLARNQLSGPIPDTIGNLSLLTELFLSANRLEGQIPSSLGNCRHLLWLDLNNNKLSGEVPRQLFQLSSLSLELDLSHNDLYGSLPADIGDLNMLSGLYLSDNNFSGNIPSSIGGCTSLSELSLEGNLFQGIIPQSFSSLRGLLQLDLSDNKLSGQIPRFLEQFSLNYLNLSFNDFEGEIPILGVFANASAFSVEGNGRLCGGLVELGLDLCKENKKHHKKFPLFLIVILTGSTLFVVLCLVYSWHKRRSNIQQSQSSMKEGFLKVSYDQLFKATNGFSEDNLIGEGALSSVYKGILDHDNKVVAVKVIHLQNRGAHKSFTRECEAWRLIRHRNLLKIITSCSSIDFQGNDFKALVYEFMPNGNLHDWLHPNINASRLNLLQRIGILIDVASAIDYLHNYCATTVIHGDLKPGNILVDEDMVAHVGDFGLARLINTYSNQNSSAGIRGTFGYAAPEYDIGSEMTTSGDVYSFGILLLEMMTGKRPTDKIFNEGLTLHKFAKMTLPDNVTDIIDDSLLDFLQENSIEMPNAIEKAWKIEECLSSIIKIGVSCSLDSPSERMNVENVVHELQHIQHTLQNI